ncbi:MAG: hypothetical protein ACHQEB_04000 [Chitinophagales bacterium]
MKKILFAIIISGIFATGCLNSAKQKAFDFNQKIAAASDTLLSKGKEFGMALNTASQDHDFSKIAVICNYLNQFINRKITEITALENVGGSEKFKTAALEFLNFEKKGIEENFMPFAKMNENTTAEEIETARKNLLQSSEQESDLLKKVQDTQQEFAKMNGLKLKEN